MKHTFYLFILVAIFLSGCIKDIDITSPGEETTIVYGLLDINDSRHFIRVQKAFLDKQLSALVMAKETDSIYYTDILKVTLNDLNNGNVFNLNRVGADTIGIPKDSGIFTNTPNILYKFDGVLDKEHTYRLVVKNTQSGNEVSSKIKIANVPELVFPIPGLELAMIDTTPFTIRWQTKPNDKVFDLIVRFNYTEKNLTTSVTSSKSFEYIAIKGASVASINGGESIDKKINKSDFYKKIAAALTFDPNLERRPTSTNTLEFILYTAGDEYDKYLQVKNAQGGITSLSYLPIYTNIDNGLGLLSSRTFTKVSNISISQVSKDSLAYGRYTKNLGFKP